MIANPDLKEGDLVPVPCRHCASVTLSIQITDSVLQIPCVKCGKASEVRIQNGMDGWAISVKAISEESEDSEEALERPRANEHAASFTPRSEASPGDTSASIIRKALAADAPAIARIHVDSWRTTYRDIVPEEHLAKLSCEKREELWNRLITDPRQFTFVAEAGGRIVGFASGGRNRGGEADYLGELYSSISSKPSNSEGWDAVSPLASQGNSRRGASLPCSPGSCRENPASEFYRKLGGKLVASKLTIIGSKTFEEVAYGWSDLPTLLQSA